MPNRIHVAFVAGLLATAAFGIAQTAPKIEEVPMQHTSPASGQQMYAAYCASCHGVDGRGNGPAAPALKVKPTDLTQLTNQNAGKFPDAHVYSVLRFGVETPAHGSITMPVWGPALRSLNPGAPSADMTEQLRLRNLTEYLRKLQK